MSILKVSCSVFFNWVCWARGNFLASRVGPGRAGPVRVFLGNPLIKLAGLYRLFCLLGIVLACVCVILQVGGGFGGAGQYDFSYFPGFVLVGPVRLKWWGVLYLNCHFLQFAVDSLGGWICAVGILSFIFYRVL
jgi:hypothetical protein